MSLNHQQIDLFIQAIEESFSGMDTRTAWPLNGGQIDAYFDVDESLDMYYRLNKLNKKLDTEEIAKLLPAADIIRLFLQHNAIIGLKVAKKLNIAKITTKEIVDYTLFIFNILEHKVKNNIFCLDGKNLLLDHNQITDILSTTLWNKPSSDEEKKDIAYLAVTANNLCYTLFYDIYMTGGFYIHGPYDATEEFGNNTILLIRDYHNLQPIEIWSKLQIPYKSMKFLGVYKGLDLRLNFVNHPLSSSSIGDKLIAYKIYLNDGEIGNISINQLSDQLQIVTTKQIKEVNDLENLDKVRKGAEIAYYLFRNLRESMGDDWRPNEQIEKTIHRFKDKFIKQFEHQEKIPLEHWKKLYDPRIDYY